MGWRRIAPVILFLLLAGVLFGSGVAGARPAQNGVTPAVDRAAPLVKPAGHDGGRHCRTRRDPVLPDPADV
jgi:hypothetical protein